MDRQTVYAGAIPLETDLLNTNKFAMIGLSKLAAAILGTSTAVNGLACTANSPASMSVNVSAGEIYSLQNIDDTAYSALGADTAHQILKQGISLDSVSLSCPAPTTSGFSINYLIEAAYLDQDANPVLLPYYNASNPSQSFSGANNNGASQNTTRKGVCSVQVKAGIAATTGSQLTPAADSGYVGLWVVTVAHGSTGITSANIAQVSGAPFISENLSAKMSQATASGLFTTTEQVKSLIQQYASQAVTLTGSANAFTGALVPAITSNSTLGEPVTVYFPSAITGAATINLGGGATALVDAQGNAFSATNTIPAGASIVQFNSTLNKFEVIGLGGIDQVARNAIANFQGEVSGIIKMWPTATAPNGYLICDGSAVSRSTYSGLFAVIGITFGSGNGSSTFNLPNYVDRMPIGAGTIGSLASTGGSKDAVAVSHTHAITDPGHSHYYTNVGAFGWAQTLSGGGVPIGAGSYTGDSTTGISIDSSGVSGTNKNLPPYMGINFIIKT